MEYWSSVNYSYDKKRRTHLPLICWLYCNTRTEFSVMRYTNINVMLGNQNRLERDMLFPWFSFKWYNGWRYLLYLFTCLDEVFFKSLGFSCTKIVMLCSTEQILVFRITSVIPFCRKQSFAFCITIIIPCGSKHILVTAPKYRDTSYFLFE